MELENFQDINDFSNYMINENGVFYAISANCLTRVFTIKISMTDFISLSSCWVFTSLTILIFQSPPFYVILCI